ncbi:RidA family protein [Fodinicurvata halophila]|uniref:RidA family protein n=1 Tax=Fodinicurvata halophila TaxID=1419723 RepID=A0ABV8UGQ8_9PROT
MVGTVDARLTELGIDIPTPASPVANYVGFVVTGNLVFISGQLPLKDGQLQYDGRLGESVSLEDGQAAARLCAINVIAQLKAACEGDLDRVTRIVRLGGFVNSVAGYKDQPKVINGASDLMAEVFADAGRHCRAAVSAGALPLDAAVEVDAIAEID